MLLKKSTLTQAARQHFGLFKDPFNEEIGSADDVFQSPDIRYVREAMFQTAAHGGFVAVVGESGAGKSTLREDLADRLLRDGRPGMTGEAYVVDQDGNILSPIRFEKSLAAPEGAEPGWSLFQLQARVMPKREDNGLPDPQLISTEPLTRVVERLLEFNSFDTGLLEDYADYRGRRVVGAGRWLPDAALGLIVEERTWTRHSAPTISRGMR